MSSSGSLPGVLPILGVMEVRMSRQNPAASRRARLWAARPFAVATFFAFVLLASVPAVAADDAVMEWNQIALAATVAAGQGPLPQVRSMAIVQVSVHDAVNAITCDYRTYLPLPCARWGHPDAAAIGAAHRALVGLFPTQAAALNQSRATSLAARGFTDTTPGVSFGEAVAAFIVAFRSHDRSAEAQFPYTAPNAGAPGVWVAVGAAAPVTPGWGSVTPWVMRSATQFETDGPPALYSRRYARDYNEVKEMGSLNSGTRTTEETNIARFWLATPSALWNGIARQVIQSENLDLSSSARTLALVYLAAADASIACWHTKYSVNFWRPMTAIHNGDADDNERTTADSAWAPLFPTPQHPEYVSGHSTNSSAMATVLMTLFGDKRDAPLVALSPTNPGFERHWTYVSEGIEEVMDARVFGGMHYRFSNEDGARLGRQIAQYVVSHSLRPRKNWRN
jgi:hypothetical protein